LYDEPTNREKNTEEKLKEHEEEGKALDSPNIFHDDTLSDCMSEDFVVCGPNGQLSVKVSTHQLVEVGFAFLPSRSPIK
jgi:hypothetical protein